MLALALLVAPLPPARGARDARELVAATSAWLTDRGIPRPALPLRVRVLPDGVDALNDGRALAVTSQTARTWRRLGAGLVDPVHTEPIVFLLRTLLRPPAGHPGRLEDALREAVAEDLAPAWCGRFAGWRCTVRRSRDPEVRYLREASSVASGAGERAAPARQWLVVLLDAPDAVRERMLRAAADRWGD
jgi:hypothetical protein